MPAARAVEVCRYTGSGDYDAHIAIITIAQRQAGNEHISVLSSCPPAADERICCLLHIRHIPTAIDHAPAGSPTGRLRTPNALASSSGNGNTIVELFSPAISLSVPR